MGFEGWCFYCGCGADGCVTLNSSANFVGGAGLAFPTPSVIGTWYTHHPTRHSITFPPVAENEMDHPVGLDLFNGRLYCVQLKSPSGVGTAPDRFGYYDLTQPSVDDTSNYVELFDSSGASGDDEYTNPFDYSVNAARWVSRRQTGTAPGPGGGTIKIVVLDNAKAELLVVNHPHVARNACLDSAGNLFHQSNFNVNKNDVSWSSLGAVRLFDFCINHEDGNGEASELFGCRDFGAFDSLPKFYFIGPGGFTSIPNSDWTVGPSGLTDTPLTVRSTLKRHWGGGVVANIAASGGGGAVGTAFTIDIPNRQMNRFSENITSTGRAILIPKGTP